MIKRRFKEYFTYTRKERNGLIVLLIILFILILIKTYQNNKPVGEIVIFDSDFQAELDSFEKSLTPKKEKEAISKKWMKNQKAEWKIPDEPFSFDPNTISEKSLSRLGFSKKQIKTLINYRNKGGVFYKNKDLTKIYGIKDSQYKALEPYIKIEKTNELSDFEPDLEMSNEYFAIIELNSATKEQLINLKGIGDAYAERIIKHRNKLGGFYKKDQLLEVYGMDSIRYAGFYNSVTIDTILIEKIDLNKANFTTLIKHPYINKYETKAILKYLELIGKITEFEQIRENNLLSKEGLIKIKPYLKLN